MAYSSIFCNVDVLGSLESVTAMVFTGKTFLFRPVASGCLQVWTCWLEGHIIKFRLETSAQRFPPATGSEGAAWLTTPRRLVTSSLWVVAAVNCGNGLRVHGHILVMTETRRRVPRGVTQVQGKWSGQDSSQSHPGWGSLPVNRRDQRGHALEHQP